MAQSANKYQGLSQEQVLASRLKHGPNTLTSPERESLWHKFAEKFTDPLIIILLVAMILSLGVAVYHYLSGQEGVEAFLEPLGVFISVILATGVAFYFEMKSEREFEILNQVNDEILYKVYRDGALHQVLKAELVVGDIVALDAGEEIPADAFLLESISLQVNESSLTGEPMVAKSTSPEDADPEATYPTNYICRGTTILDGHCVCQIDKVGDATEYGRVFEGAQIDTSVETPLNRQLRRLARTITIASYSVAALVLVGSVIVYASQGGFAPFDWIDALDYFLLRIMIAVTIIVVAVPEGLPMSVTLSLAYSMRSMMKTGNLVRRMHACETMGAATVICTDKTGTLTQNRMTIADVHFMPGVEASELLHVSMAVNATAHLEHVEGEQPKVLGNPTEGALLLWLSGQGVRYEALRDEYRVLSQLTFSTERKYMATVTILDGRKVLLVKGAPEIVMAQCHISPETQAEYEAKLMLNQSRAMRTIAFAYREVDTEHVFEDGRVKVDGWTFLGIVGISDPIRDEVPEAIRTCMKAGIKVKIITGDTSGTAKEIGRQIGLWTEECDERHIITGTEFAALSDEELRDRVGGLRIMSRARPMDKERLVRLLQEQGEVVAVTGDGTNDAPALNRAQVGLSMGDATSVAKEASDITILDNSFASITQAVLWGRSLYLNIQRFIIFQMTINVAACLIVLAGAFLGMESPLTVTQMLWVNLIMDTFAALALASLPPNKKVMNDQPRSQSANIITPAMGRRILGLGFFFVALLFVILRYLGAIDLSSLLDVRLADIGTSIMSTGGQRELTAYELTVFFVFFVFLQFWNMFNAKAYSSGDSAFSGLVSARNFLFIAGVIVLGQIGITTFGGQMFRVVPLDAETWGILFLITSPVLIVGELIRFLTSKRTKA